MTYPARNLSSLIGIDHNILVNLNFDSPKKHLSTATGRCECHQNLSGPFDVLQSGCGSVRMGDDGGLIIHRTACGPAVLVSGENGLDPGKPGFLLA